MIYLLLLSNDTIEIILKIVQWWTKNNKDFENFVYYQQSTFSAACFWLTSLQKRNLDLLSQKNQIRCNFVFSCFCFSKWCVWWNHFFSSIVAATRCRKKHAVTISNETIKTRTVSVENSDKNQRIHQSYIRRLDISILFSTNNFERRILWYFHHSCIASRFCQCN